MEKYSVEPLVYIIIVNYNGWKDTVECLTSLTRLTYSHFNVVVVDNDSSDNSETIIRQHFPDRTMLQSGKNLGFAGGNNLGIRYAIQKNTDYVWLLNNDTVVDPESLSYLVKRMQEKPSAGMCGSRLLYYDRKEIVQVLGGSTYNKWLGVQKPIGEGESADIIHTPNEIEAQLSYIIGASLLVSRALIETIGYMNEDYFLYYEEIDWSIRAKDKYTLAYAPQSVVYHKEGSTIGTTKSQIPSAKRLRSEFYSLRSRLIFTRNHFPEALPTVYVGIFLMFAKRVLRGEWVRIKTLGQAVSLLLKGQKPN
ncbi:MAG: glycosyltransferase family 2 protein [Trueperaceae bacterium]